MYVKYDGNFEEGNISLISRNFSIEEKSEDSKEEPRFMKITNHGVKQANHIICRVAEGTEAAKNNMRILIDIKDNTTVEYLKDRIVDR